MLGLVLVELVVLIQTFQKFHGVHFHESSLLFHTGRSSVGSAHFADDICVEEYVEAPSLF